MAAQTLVDEAYGTKDVGTAVTVGDSTSGSDVTYDKVEELAELETGTVTEITLDTAGTKVATLTYSNGSNTCKYDPTKSSTNTDGDYNVN